MPVHCFAPMLGKRIRVTQLDECGRPLPDATPNAILATDGFVTVSLSSETEDGNEILVRKASGALCVNEKQPNAFKRFNVDIEFCGVNPALLSMVTNAEPYEDAAGDIAGITVPEGDITKKFALELWTGISGIACAEGAEEASGYLLLPFVNGGTLGDVEVNGEDAITFSMSGAYTKGQNGWGVGPFAVVADAAGNPAGLPTPLDPYDHLLIMDTGIAPPPSACDPLPMSSEVEPPAAPAAWAASTAYALGDRVTLADGDVLEVSTAGTSDDDTAPIGPGVGLTVADGTVTWTQVSEG